MEKRTIVRKIKNGFGHAPILSYMSEYGQYIVDTDTSNFASVAVLS